MADRFTIDNWMVAWNPAEGHARGPSGSVLVGPWPDRTRWSDRYLFTTGCCEIPRHQFTIDQKIAQLFIDFHTLVVRDGVDPQVAHREFLKIEEYRRRISSDISGAARDGEDDA